MKQEAKRALSNISQAGKRLLFWIPVGLFALCALLALIVGATESFYGFAAFLLIFLAVWWYFTPKNPNSRTVYITRNGRSFHLDRDCPYIASVPQAVRYGRVKRKRRPCEYCCRR